MMMNDMKNKERTFSSDDICKCGHESYFHKYKSINHCMFLYSKYIDGRICCTCPKFIDETNGSGDKT
jgi:hypothetical protein